MAHVLLAEDEVLIALMFQDALEEEGHRVTVARDGIEALEADARDPAEALVTDLAMPRMGGRELLDRLRERRPDLPAVVVTGYAGEVHLGAPLTVLLAKPVSPRALTARLTQLLADSGTVRDF
ncbi:response regulator [Skermanella mucosa]|uniref:response regulator n=1 Tax=Skermanella mucosa TaxID=1789672 RepID=UPI001E589B4C|nr:response regulator [Skermanella mucosa]UEM18952.1 response regulator [Skermanella mucosa]